MRAHDHDADRVLLAFPHRPVPPSIHSASLEAAYAYGVLDRFDVVGGTHFLQTQVQAQIK